MGPRFPEYDHSSSTGTNNGLLKRIQNIWCAKNDFNTFMQTKSLYKFGTGPFCSDKFVTDLVQYLLEMEAARFDLTQP